MASVCTLRPGSWQGLLRPQCESRASNYTLPGTDCSRDRTQPFDVVKSRVSVPRLPISATNSVSQIMNASGETSVASVISRAFRREGVGWMLRGWTPAWVRLGPNSLIIFLVLEQMRNAVDRARAQGYNI